MEFFVPEESVETQLSPAPEIAHINNLGIDVCRRIIWLAEIEETDGELIQRVLTYLNALSDDEITLYINTPGGDCTSMFAIHDAIRTSKAPIHGIGYGQIASAGVLILACCPRRSVTECCVFMSHEPTVGGDENSLGLRAAKDRRKWEDWLQSWWCVLMARYTPADKDARWWKRMTEKNGEYWLLGGDDIVAEGLADAVIPDLHTPTEETPS